MKSANTTCVICGQPDAFGLSICVGCGGQAHAIGDTLIFVKPGADGRERRWVAQTLSQLLAGRTHRAERRLVAAGHRALLRIPAAAADRVIRQLAHRHVPATARSAVGTWVSAPASFYLLLATMAFIGIWAGLSANPLFRWTTPLVTLLLLLAAQRRLKEPVLRTPSRHAVFPARIEGMLLETFARLSDGVARDLLARLVQAAEPVYRALARVKAGVTRADVEALLRYGSRAALDLSELTVAAGALDGDPAAHRVTRLAATLEQRFRLGISVLHRVRAETVEDDPTHTELAALLEALDADAEAFAEARREVAALLDGNA